MPEVVEQIRCRRAAGEIQRPFHTNAYTNRGPVPPLWVDRNAGRRRVLAFVGPPHPVWGRIVPDIPTFCRELVAALVAGKGYTGTDESRPVAVSREKCGEDAPELLGLFYVWGVPAVSENLLAVASASLRVLVE